MHHKLFHSFCSVDQWLSGETEVYSQCFLSAWWHGPLTITHRENQGRVGFRLRWLSALADLIEKTVFPELCVRALERADTETTSIHSKPIKWLNSKATWFGSHKEVIL